MTFVLALKALDTNGRNATGPISNIVSVSMENFEGTDHPLKKAILIIVGVIGSVAGSGIPVTISLVRRKQSGGNNDGKKKSSC